VTEIEFQNIAPVVHVANVDAALDRYRRLGFTVELDKEFRYGFAERGEVSLHLAESDDARPDSGAVVYIYVSDADALHTEWSGAGVGGKFIGPHNTTYGLREFVFIDSDGTVHRVGSPLGDRGAAVAP
jgi:predicted enzyme related to lactoylglutathione lyase